MPLINPSHDSLPYIDRPPTPTSTAHAHTLIRSSLPPDTTTPHPLLPPSPLTSIPHSPLIQLELSRIASTTNSTTTPLSAIDLSRYEAPSLPPSTDLPHLRETLRAAYTTSTYLSLRLQALELLEKYGKNAWVFSNWETENLLGSLEKELEGVRGAVEGVNRERRGGQEGWREELEGLEEEWRGGVRGVVEVGVEVGRVEGGVREALRGGR